MTVPGESAPTHLEQVARPLLSLVSHLTGMETAFVTTIDWGNLRQEVMVSRNSGGLQVAEGGSVDWKDSMCRTMFLSGRVHTDEVPLEPLRPAGVDATMQSFFALPILVDDATVGTVCGASQSRVALDEHQVQAMEMIADAMRHLIQAEVAMGRTQEQLRQAEGRAEQLLLLANTDELTDLPNRRAFAARWEDQLARSGRKHHPIGVMLIDMDRFKAVNDTFGHSTGDAVLRLLGNVLRTAAGSLDLVGRLGGDEFAFGITHADDAAIVALADDIRTRFADASAQLGAPATISIGIATSAACSRDGLLGAADRALYCSKSDGGNRINLWQEELADA